MPRIAVIGAGQLGSRHLQALCRSHLAFDVHVADPSPASLDIARQRLAEVNGGNVTATFTDRLPDGAHYDVVVVATSSGPRAAATRDLLTRCTVGAVIFEKILFTRLEDYDAIGSLLAQKGVKAWVNCPRRMYPHTKPLSALLSGPVSLAMQGGMWGMACNSIHFVDFVAHLCGTDTFTWDVSGLDPVLHESPRHGYREFSGTLVVRGDDGSVVRLSAIADSAASPVVHIIGSAGSAVLDEINNIGTLYRRDEGWKPEAFSFRLPYQSELTHLAVESILADGQCPLTPYDVSARLHRPMLKAFLDHCARCGLETDTCPVT